MSLKENLETPEELGPGEEAELDQWLKEWGPIIKMAYAEDPKLIPLFFPILVAGFRLERPFTIEQAKLLARKITEHQVIGRYPREVNFSPGLSFFYFHKHTASSPIEILLGVAQESLPSTFRLKTHPVAKVFADEYLQPTVPEKTGEPICYYLSPKVRSLVSVDELLIAQEKERLAA